MEKKIDLGEIFLKHHDLDSSGCFTIDSIYLMMKEACEQVLILASENANIKHIKGMACDDHTPYMGPCCSCGEYNNREIVIGSVIDKQSIIDTIKQVK